MRQWWTPLIVVYLSFYLAATQHHRKALYPSAYRIKRGTYSLINPTFQHSMEDVNLLYEILLAGMQIQGVKRTMMIPDEELASLRRVEKLEVICDDVLPKRLSDIRRLTAMLAQRQQPLSWQDFERTVLTLVYTTQTLARVSNQQQREHVSIHLMPKRLALLTLGGLIDEEVVMEFLFQHRGSAFAPCNHSNDDDDEFWDASGRYLTEHSLKILFIWAMELNLTVSQAPEKPNTDESYTRIVLKLQQSIPFSKLKPLNMEVQQSSRFPAKGMVPLVADGRPTQSGIETKMSAPQSHEKMSPQVNAGLINESLAWNYLNEPLPYDEAELTLDTAAAPPYENEVMAIFFYNTIFSPFSSLESTSLSGVACGGCCFRESEQSPDVYELMAVEPCASRESPGSQLNEVVYPSSFSHSESGSTYL
ncbi:Protein FAM180A [Larimichthys crocea]|uniref:Uncharacterized protein n=1 Tax=Larimichthys crocea TaxID=215358 RepID=A0ACD3Q7C2_LARCR|nr:Protein FAM180A [Larimichthys crocea]